MSVYDNFTLISTIPIISIVKSKRLTPAQRAAIQLPSHILDALIGIMLSDGHLNRRGINASGNTRFMFTQSGKYAKREYFSLVFDLFASFMTPETKLSGIVVKPIKSYKGESYTKVTLNTMGLPCFNYLHSIFYVGGVKCVPEDIINLLTPCGLAHWIMGDGSKQGHGVHLSVYAFSSLDVALLIAALTKMGLQCTVHKHVAGPRIFISKSSMPLLCELVTPYMVPTMMYKLSK